MNLKIKPSKSSDFLEVAALDRIAWKSNSHSEFIPDGEHVWRIWCENALMFTAFLDKKIVGAILAFPCLDDTFCIHKVFVHPTQRNQGIGAKLFEVLNSKLDELQKDGWLTVSPDNENARKLYAKWGFTNETFCKGFYRSYEDRFVLLRNFER
ncbi:MAG: GNAT family N-acetyltransferase [Saprospiraceae bacterium]